jgi:hypothetical protein
MTCNTRALAARISVLALGLFLCLGIGAPPEAAAQNARERLTLLSAPELRNSPVVARGGYLVVVDLDDNQLHFMQGRTILWSAPVGTGMDLRLETDDRKWDFGTPRGVYEVKYKEENPVWIAPDWYFIENKLPVPPVNDPKRRFPGSLGVAAVYLGAGMAIHGTDKPDLLGQRVSHGCIRLANEYAQRLFHNVRVGTKVVIIGGEEQGERGKLIPGQVPGAGPVDARTQRLRDRAKAERQSLQRELGALSTADLLERLDEEIRAHRPGSAATRWTESASDLVRRAVKDQDAEAAKGLLGGVDGIRNRTVRAEYLTYVADLYWRASPTVAQALGTMQGRTRDAAAGAIVEATLALFAGDTDAQTTPWPSRQILRTALDDQAQGGWDVILQAERAYRERRTGSQPARTGRL